MPSFEVLPEKPEQSESQRAAAEMGKETGLDENGLEHFLREVKNGDVADLQDLIDHYGLKPILNRPDVVELAKRGMKNAEKERRADAASVMKAIFKL